MLDLHPLAREIEILQFLEDLLRQVKKPYISGIPDPQQLLASQFPGLKDEVHKHLQLVVVDIFGLAKGGVQALAALREDSEKHEKSLADEVMSLRSEQENLRGLLKEKELELDGTRQTTQGSQAGFLLFSHLPFPIADQEASFIFLPPTNRSRCLKKGFERNRGDAYETGK